MTSTRSEVIKSKPIADRLNLLRDSSNLCARVSGYLLRWRGSSTLVMKVCTVDCIISFSNRRRSTRSSTWSGIRLGGPSCFSLRCVSSSHKAEKFRSVLCLPHVCNLAKCESGRFCLALWGEICSHKNRDSGPIVAPWGRDSCLKFSGFILPTPSLQIGLPSFFVVRIFRWPTTPLDRHNCWNTPRAYRKPSHITRYIIRVSYTNYDHKGGSLSIQEAEDLLREIDMSEQWSCAENWKAPSALWLSSYCPFL